MKFVETQTQIISVTVTERKQLTPTVSNKLSVVCSKFCDIRIQSNSSTTIDKILEVIS